MRAKPRLAALQPAPVSQAENLEFDLRGVHPADTLEHQLGDGAAVGPDFRPLIHDADAAKRELEQQMR